MPRALVWVPSLWTGLFGLGRSPVASPGRTRRVGILHLGPFPRGPVFITLRPGTTLPLCNSATGRAFATFYRSPYLKRMLDEKNSRAISENTKTAITTVRRQFEKTLPGNPGARASQGQQIA